MNSDEKPKTSVFVIAGALFVVATGAAAVMVPRMQSARAAGEAEVSSHLERARRVLAQYDNNLSVEAGIREVAGDQPFELPSERLEELLDDPVLDITGEASKELKEYADRPEIKGLDSAEQELLTKIYGPVNWQQHRSPRPPSRVSGAGMITKGSTEHHRRLGANHKLLADALQEVSAALAVSRGDYSARQHAAANRMEGMILYEQGLALEQKVLLMRSLLAERRLALKRQASKIAVLAQDQGLTAASEIESRIADAQAEQDRVAGAIGEKKALVSELQSKVGDLEQRAAAAVERSEAAREAMEALQDMGVDLSSPDGLTQFNSAFNEQAENYRRALAEAHALRYGTLQGATIDHTGDYIRGRYVPIDRDGEVRQQRGLVHYRNDLETAQAELAKMEEQGAQQEESVQTLREVKSNLDQRVKQSADSIAQKRAQTESDYAEFTELNGRVHEVEQEVIDHFEKSIAAFKQAEIGVRNEENRAREERPDNPERQPYHYSAVAGDQGWLRGQILAQQADAEIGIGLILLGTYQDAGSNIADLGELDIARDDLASWEETIQISKTAAVERAQSAIDILDNQAQDRIGDGNWTVAAEIGAAHYLLSVLDVELEAERALEWYKVAVENRETLVPEHVFMRDYIESRMPKEQN